MKEYLWIALTGTALLLIIVCFSRIDHTRRSLRSSLLLVEEVSGLRNEEVAVFISLSQASKKTAVLAERIIPSARTWMRGFVHVFVLADDSFSLRYQLRHCVIEELQELTTFSCRHEATYVLVRGCSGEMGRCQSRKIDEMARYVLLSAELSRVKYLLHAEDDTYIRAVPLLAFLSVLDKKVTSPLIGNGVLNDLSAGLPSTGKVQKPICTEISRHGEYSPMLLNRAALLCMKESARSHAMEQLFDAFRLSPAWSTGVYAWLLRLTHVFIPHVELNAQQKQAQKQELSSEYIIVKGIKPAASDKCGSPQLWPEEWRYLQRAVIGCGDGKTVLPTHTQGLNMYDVHRFYTDLSSPETDSPKQWVEQFERAGVIETPIKGYEATAHYRMHHSSANTSERWVPFTAKDCE